MRYTFDGTAVAPNEGGAEHWPAGNYPVVAVANAYKATAGVPPGERLTYKVQCIDGPLKGKINYIGFNVVNASETAQRIAKEQLSAMSWAVGKPRWQDTDELHNIPFVVTVQWTDKGNNFTKFMNMQGVDALTLHNQAKASGVLPSGPGPQMAPQQAPQMADPQQPWGGPASTQAAPNGPAPQQAWGGPAPAPAPQPEPAPAGQQWSQPAQAAPNGPAQPVIGPAPGQQAWGGQPAPGQPAPWGG